MIASVDKEQWTKGPPESVDGRGLAVPSIANLGTPCHKCLISTPTAVAGIGLINYIIICI